MGEFGRLGCDSSFLRAPAATLSDDEMSDHGPSELSNKVPKPVQKTSSSAGLIAKVQRVWGIAGIWRHFRRSSVGCCWGQEVIYDG
jgi:hypothetical protein